MAVVFAGLIHMAIIIANTVVETISHSGVSAYLANLHANIAVVILT
jgi:hypothetical protein